MEADLQSIGAAALTLLGALGLVVLRWAVHQVKGVRATIADDLVRTLARRLAVDTPDPEAHAAEPSDADRVLGDLSRRVGVEVRAATAPLGRRLSRLENQVRRVETDICVLLEHDAEAEQRTAEHSGRLGAVEAVTGVYPIEELSIGESTEHNLSESIEEL